MTTDMRLQNPQQEPRVKEKVPKRRSLSRDPNKAMQEMMVIIDTLRTSLVEETNVLKDADTKTFLTLQDRKVEVSRDYLDGMTQLLARKEDLLNADEDIKQQLETKRNEFAEVASQNHAALERMKSGMKRLGERIMESAREAARKEEQIIYGSSGHMQVGAKASMGINESA